MRALQALVLPLALYSSSVTQVRAPKEHARTQAGSSPFFTRSLHPSHFTIFPSEARYRGAPKGHAMAQLLHPMQLVLSYTVNPVSGSLYRHPTGQAGMQGASTQCMQAAEM